MDWEMRVDVNAAKSVGDAGVPRASSDAQFPHREVSLPLSLLRDYCPSSKGIAA
jgi:hypothetical protein